jgi:hypothetical protein
MKRALDNLLKDALARKPKQLLFDTSYSHKTLHDWLKTFLPEWKIIIPDNKELEPLSALSDWPANGNCRNGVKQWLQENMHQTPDDLIDGACEPLAFWLSDYIKYCQIVDKNNFERSNIPIVTYDRDYLLSTYREAKSRLENMEPSIAAKCIFGDYIKQEVPSPLFWPDVSLEETSYKDYLFGHHRAMKRILEVVEANFLLSEGRIIISIPLYVLCYIFDNDELTNAELKNAKEETAQYSLHVVGLVINSFTKTIIIADSNGALRGGSNMEFLSMPLTKLNHGQATTKVSSFDKDERKHVVYTQTSLAKKARLQ